MNKTLAIFLAGMLYGICPALAGPGGGRMGGVANTTSLGAVTISSLTVTNSASIGTTATVGTNLTIGSGASSALPQLIFNKSNAGAAQIIMQDQGAQRFQETLDSGEAMLFRTDSNQAMTFGTNSQSNMVLDTSGRLNLGQTITNGNRLVNISTTSAMFSVDGSTATGSNALASIATATPCGSNSVIGVEVRVAASNGVGPTSYYLLGCPK